MTRSLRIALLGAALTIAAAPGSAANAPRHHSTNAITPAELRALAHGYYAWRDSMYPVGTSDQGNHRWDNRLTDFRMTSVRARREHVRLLLARVRAMPTSTWNTDDRVESRQRPPSRARHAGSRP